MATPIRLIAHIYLSLEQKNIVNKISTKWCHTRNVKFEWTKNLWISIPIRNKSNETSRCCGRSLLVLFLFFFCWAVDGNKTTATITIIQMSRFIFGLCNHHSLFIFIQFVSFCFSLLFCCLFLWLTTSELVKQRSILRIYTNIYTATEFFFSCHR